VPLAHTQEVLVICRGSIFQEVLEEVTLSTLLKKFLDCMAIISDSFQLQK